MRGESVELFNRFIHVSIDGSYKEEEFEQKVSEITNKLHENKNKIDDALLNNLYEVYYDTWVYDQEREISKEEFFENIMIESIVITKNDSCTLNFTTGPLLDANPIEVIYDKDGTIFITGSLPHQMQ